MLLFRRCGWGAPTVARTARLPVHGLRHGAMVQTGLFSRGFATEEKFFDKVLVANRGEIAVRVMKSCQKLGIKTVAVFSEADRYAKHVQMADEAVYVGPPASAESYLNQPAILDAIKQTGAQAVHPGYGFLSENSTFSKLLEENDVKFIGPKEYAIISMGDKIASKQIARDAEVNTIPGWLGEVESDEQVIEIAREIGYPVMVKASAGGGGKGMRVAWNDEEAVEGFRLSKQEALASFGDDTIFLEKFIEEPRHIEIQVLCDAHGNGIYLNERECSIQRRNQKVIEEAPSVFLTPETRKAMGEQAVALAKAVQYESAGTVEFLVDKHRNFYFLEMNTRLQVEHPVTEYITGVDLVEQMLRVAAGLPLALTQDDIGINGWSFESRVYAEDPLRDFLPSIGRLERYTEPTEQEPGSNDVRVDSGVREGDPISIYYDPMISKLVTFGKDRDTALEKMRVALDEYVIGGLTHNLPFLRSLTDHPRFIAGELTTAFIDEEYPEGYLGHQLTQDDKELLLAAVVAVHKEHLQAQLDMQAGSGSTGIFDSTKFIENNLSSNVVTLEGETFDVAVDEVTAADSTLRVNGSSWPTSCSYSKGDQVFTAAVGSNAPRRLQMVKADQRTSSYTLQLSGSQFELTIRTAREEELAALMPVHEPLDMSKVLVSPMPGAIFSVNVAVGDTVVMGQEMCVVEAMKMQNVLRAAADGVVKTVLVEPGATVSADEVLMELDPK